MWWLYILCDICSTLFGDCSILSVTIVVVYVTIVVFLVLALKILQSSHKTFYFISNNPCILLTNTFRGFTKSNIKYYDRHIIFFASLSMNVQAKLMFSARFEERGKKRPCLFVLLPQTADGRQLVRPASCWLFS